MKLNLHIRELREAKGLRIADLAEMIGVSVSHLSEVERGKKNVNNHLLVRLSDALGVPSEALVSSQAPTRTLRLNAVAATLSDEDMARLTAYAEALHASADHKQKQ